ncbi:hypothetical protein G6F42_025503 [Rhizopus arrhizus]|nr:hypothetical protein G6F42_025503 [Rhizopus arrhizus]
MSIQSSNSAPGSPLSSASVSAQIKSGEPDISRISLGERDNEDGDIEMKQAEVSPVKNASLGTADDDANGQQHMVEIRSKIEELNRTISTIKHSVKLSGERVTAFIKGVSVGSSNAAAGGISLSNRDLPKFQLKSDSVKYSHGEESFDSIFHFLAVFEKVVSSSGQDVESVCWKRWYLPLTIPYE